ncbi:hypothetical protein EDD16DRAFT_1648138 [Pisolithus croceorrhizus]|nr:hypothetical protein EDD16DRAFT_1648138 [Pisolithus croceorrhizus]
MPLVTNLVDDKSPLIQYDSTWKTGTSTDDQALDQYYHSTATTNDVMNGHATFTFNGTAIWWYGSLRDNHGTFLVQIDNDTYGPYNGYSAVDQFLVPIFNISGLNQGTHQLTLTNTGSGSTIYVAADAIVWQSDVGGEDDQLVTETIDDPDPRFQYQDSLWISPSDVDVYSNGTGHHTEEQTSATLTFTVQMVTLFGKTGPSNGPYTVQLDGGQTNTYNATINLPYYGITLFHADNLGSGQHQLTITNSPSAGGQGLGIDYAIVSSLSSTTTTSSSSYSQSTSSKQLSTGAIVGIAVPAAIAALSFFLAFCFYRKWKAAEAIQNQLLSVYTSQRPQEAAAGFTTSLDARGHQSSGNAYQRAAGDGWEGVIYPPRPAVSRPGSRPRGARATVGPVPLSSQPLRGPRQGSVDHPRLEGGGVHQRTASPTTTELPNYSQVVGANGR